MIYQFLIVLFVASNLLFQVSATTQKPPKEAPSTAATNTTSSPPKETSYFYRDPQGPGTYEFGYHIEDEATGNIQFREERRYANGTVTGSFGYLRPDGKMSVTHYIADENGYRKRTKVNKHPSTSTTSPSTTIGIPGLDLNAGTLPPQLVEGVMDKYDIDLNPNANPSDILHPDILDIINGKIPLKKDKKNSRLGFEVVHNFIPKDFPIVPFQLPTELPYREIDD